MQPANQDRRGQWSHALLSAPPRPLGTAPTLLVNSEGTLFMPLGRPCPGIPRPGASVRSAPGTRLELTFSRCARPAERSTCTPWFLSRPRDLREEAGSCCLPERGREPAARKSGSVHPSAVLPGQADWPRRQKFSPGPACVRPHGHRQDLGLQPETSRDPLRLGAHPSSFCMDRGKEKTFPTPTRVSLVTVYIRALSPHFLPLSQFKKKKQRKS